MQREWATDLIGVAVMSNLMMDRAHALIMQMQPVKIQTGIFHFWATQLFRHFNPHKDTNARFVKRSPVESPLGTQLHFLLAEQLFRSDLVQLIESSIYEQKGSSRKVSHKRNVWEICNFLPTFP